MSNRVSTMVKKVNVIAPIPIRTVNPPIYGKKEGLSMTPANILKCIIGRATVYEILSDGSKLRLTTSNYNKENHPVPKFVRAKAPEVEKKPGPVVSKSDAKKRIVICDKIETKDKVNIEEVKENLDIVKDESGEPISIPEVNIEEAQPEEIVSEPEEAKEVISDEEDPELIELAAEIAKLEAEEAKKKREESIVMDDDY